jgi:hypothetical protein
MKTTMIWVVALAGLGTAAPTPVTYNRVLGSRQAAMNGTLPGITFIDGQQFNLKSPTAVGPCAPTDDVATCAGKIAAKWTLPGNVTSEIGHLSFHATCYAPNSYNPYDCIVTAPYQLEFSDCKISDPIEVSRGDLIDCNASNGSVNTVGFEYDYTDNS